MATAAQVTKRSLDRGRDVVTTRKHTQERRKRGLDEGAVR
jgi:hypothetical protein